MRSGGVSVSTTTVIRDSPSRSVCPTVSDEMSAALLEDLGADGLIELTAKIGFMNLAARSNVALGIPSEQFADACGLEPLASRPAPAAMQ